MSKHRDLPCRSKLSPIVDSTIKDPQAKGGEAVILRRTGQRATFELQGVPSGSYRVSVRARADAYQGWPIMRLYLSGQRLGKDNAVERKRYGAGLQTFGKAQLKEGDMLEAEFTNDLYGGSKDKDRNLIVDYLILEPVAEAPRSDDARVQTIIDDMTLPHEGKLHGVPDYYNWAKGPSVDGTIGPGTWTAFIAWGQLYEAAEGNPATNTRVQIGEMTAYYLSKSDSQWHLLQRSRAKGAAYREDFSGDVSKPADVRDEASRGISVTAGGGYNFHFWPEQGRVDIDPADIVGVFTTFKARLITADADKPDDRAKAKYLLGTGCDYWLSKNASWDNWETNGRCALGRMKVVRQDWRTFSAHTLPAIRQNPPPLE